MYFSVLYKLLMLSVNFLCWFILAVISADDRYKEVGVAVMLGTCIQEVPSLNWALDYLETFAVLLSL
jgi:hypothetical protein